MKNFKKIYLYRGSKYEANANTQKLYVELINF